MDRISAKGMFFRKRIFPFIWFGFIAVFIATAGVAGVVQKDPFFLLVPVAMAVFGYLLMRKLVWDLADEVTDHGTYLRVRRGAVEDRVELTNIMNIDNSFLVNPPRATLRLITPGSLGKEIAFSPKRLFTLNPFARNPIIEDLIERVHRAKSNVAR
jgi:hypothetical protein